MNCSLLVGEFRTGLRSVERAIGRTASLPILSSIYLRAHKNKIIIRSTNLDVGIETTLPAQVKGDGEVVVPAIILLQLIQSLHPIKDIYISTQGQDLLIDTDNQKTRLKGYPVSEYPTFPTIVHEVSGVVSGTQLLQTLSRVSLVVATNTIRQELVSISFTFAKKTICAATDSFRLTEESIEGRDVTKSTTVLIPLHTIQNCITLLSQNTPKDVSIIIGEGSIQFTIGRTQLLSRLLEGKFPPYTDILPKNTTTTITINNELLSGALKQARVFTGKLADIHLTVHHNDGLQIEAQSPDIGEYNNIIPASIEGNPVTIVLNWKYLTDALQGRDGNISLTCTSGQDPIKISSEGINGFHIIMPMRGIV